MRDLNEDLVLVTGGGTGIGLAVARALSSAGARVVIAGRRQATLDEAASSGGLDPLSLDVTDADEVEAAVSKLGPISVLVNAAGVIQATPVHEFTVEDFDRVLNTNLRGAFLLSRAVLPGMRERGDGVIVNVGSVAARVSFEGMGAYSASKAALAALGGVIRAENRALGIRVVDVVAGATATPLWSGFWPDAPLDRMMDPADVADAVLTAVRGPGQAAIEEVVIRPVAGDL